ncbi:MAG: hypothetical protein ABS87_09400 [Sphingomonas sp. SCN 67-18]|uniref:peptidylprolyl isomerase n=1 Tax=uncultured Sphingomonas sp. TaxID=158754 RepID=UPI00086ED961|nr:peptidylprolyl isomerase [Sphingomonas sp. SCN 67-18]ODU20729.1 MAG: hypothetical protein ABS87_09400 [Sphingomonas sp. SCN 67-18]
MFSFFRRLTESKIGLVIVFAFLGLIAFAFAASDLSNTISGTGGAPTGSTIATVGKQKIDSVEFGQRVQTQFDNFRNQQPDLTLARFISEGGFDTVLARTIDGVALGEFGRMQGMVVSRKAEDGQIASVPAFAGLNGQFDKNNFAMFLQRTRISEAQFRADLARDTLADQMILPVSGAVRAPLSLITPYASMLLEGRTGRLAFVPAAAMRAAPAPTDAALNSYYTANIARYTVPERRVVRYAIIDRDRFIASSKATPAEIQKAYQDNKDSYAGRETRTLTQLITPTEAAAKALAARVVAGATLAQAAKDAGLEPTTLDNQTRAGFAELSSPAVAAAVFAAGRGTVAPPARSGLGWHVVRVDSINIIPARTLADVQGEIAATLDKEKADAALADIVAKMEDDISGGATFDEVVAAQKLQAVTTRPMLAKGGDPDAPQAAVTPEMTAIFDATGGMEADDDAIVAQIVPNQRFALVDLDSIIPATPKPLAQIRDQVTKDFAANAALAEARKIANAVAAKVSGGTTLAQAVSGAGVALPAPTAIGGKRQEIMRNGRADGPTAMLFSMVEGKARVLQAPDRSGWYVVHLESIQRGDATGRPDVIAAARAEFAPVLGQEYVEQFVAAARAEVGSSRNAAAVAKLKRDLTGGDDSQ